MPIVHRLVLFGSLSLETPDGKVKKLPPGRPTELLGFLAARAEAVARSEAAAALWPDESEAVARQNLRQTLLALRALLGAAPLFRADRHTLALDYSLVETDVGKLWTTGETCLASLDVDTDSFLRGIETEWVIEERRRLSRRVVDRALRAASALAHLPLQSAAYAEIAAAAEPLMEAPRTLKIRAALALGNRGLAELEVERYEEALLESGLPPSTSLRALLRADGIEEVDDGEGSPSQKLTLASARAPFLVAQGLASRARSSLIDAIDGCRGGTPADLSCAHAALSLVFLHEGNYEEAVRAAKEAKSLADGPVTRGRALAALARAYNGLGRASRAIAYAQDGFREAEAGGDDATLATLLAAAAMARATRHEPTEAETLLRRADPLARASGDRLLSSRILHLLGHVLTQTCGREAASRAFQSAREALEGRQPQMAVLIKLDLARIQEEEGDTRAAQATYVEAVSEARTLSDSRSLTQGLTYLADLESNVGNFEIAYRGHAEAASLRRISGDRLGLATSLRGLARAAWGLGSPDEARKFLSEAIGLYIAGGDRKNLGRARMLLAHILERERPQVARNVVRQALRDLAAVAGPSDTSPGQDRLYTAAAGVELARRLGEEAL